jgi:NAD(P)-dependent dehydrogenase (short-subunit alcohol dehydrogenase family)
MREGLAGRVALVTGGATGIGRVIALTFAQAGATVIIADVDERGAEETVRLIMAVGGVAHAVATDVSRAAAVATLLTHITATWGRLDCACNNAGMADGAPTWLDVTEDAWERVLALNLTGVWLCMRAEIRQMLTQGHGTIVNLASIFGLVGSPTSPALTATKHGVIGLTKSAAVARGLTRFVGREQELAAIAQALARAGTGQGQVVAIHLFPESAYTFKHALTHEVAYSSLLLERRRRLHRHIVEAIEALAPSRVAEQVERLAYHALRGEVWDKAVTCCQQAGARAYDRSAFHEAVVYFEQALQALAHLPETHETQVLAIELRLALGGALNALGDNKRHLPPRCEISPATSCGASPGRQGLVSPPRSLRLMSAGNGPACGVPRVLAPGAAGAAPAGCARPPGVVCRHRVGIPGDAGEQADRIPTSPSRTRDRGSDGDNSRAWWFSSS